MNNDPYQTPASTLEDVHPMPSSYLAGVISSNRLRLSAWLAMLYAILAIPATIVSIAAESGYASPELETYNDIATVLFSAIAIYLLLTMKKFLLCRFNFDRITVQIYISIALTLTMIGARAIADVNIQLLVTLGLLVPLGIVNIIIGRRVLNIRGYPHILTLGRVIIVTGALEVSVILVMLIVITDIVSNVLLAMIFFHGRKELLEHSNQAHSLTA